MRPLLCALVTVCFAVACRHGKAPVMMPAAPETPDAVVAAGKATIEQWREAYEVRSVDALTKLYAHDKDLVVVTDGQPLVGWLAVQPALAAKLGRAKEVHVRLQDEQVTSVAPTVATALATMTREIGDGVTTVTEKGALTLVLRHDSDGWKIVAEHYSYTRP